MTQAKNIKLLFNLYILDVIVIAAMIVAALVLQFALTEIPCPLCLLQRLGILGIAVGFLMNLRFGIRPSHYALSLLSAIFAGYVALRQITLHIMPGDKGYGEALFGLHLYTWVFLASVAMVLYITVLLFLDDQFKQSVLHQSKKFKILIATTFSIIVLVMVVNIVTTFLECGLQQCPDNPVVYKYLENDLA
ncbi:MAG: hypothetical protein A3F17_01555 [Gammaproteobacteria bacterium RIFCSPHIGHO2_12_FULL_41_15]|nr:MAG: hypothetical protein A3F17_01555 [Gammaproteobacteria bacterium RIFCSPHIGHO2_12_FULL_41_15]